MAREITKTLALSRRLSLGRQCQSLHFPRRRAKESRWADAGVPNEIATASQTEGDRLVICALTEFEVAALFGQLGAATWIEPLGSSIHRGLVLL